MMSEQDLEIVTSSTTYPVVVGSGVLGTLPARLSERELHGACWLVSDSNVFPHYGAALEDHLTNAGYTVRTYVVPAGEASKSHEQFWDLCTWMIGNGVERRDVVLALGGGVVGDLAGFAAASVLRGIACVQLPTTLLAMVDAALGGKTGINHPLGKNLVGAFHQPRLVLADTLTLHTLAARELCAGWAEVIKHGVIRDAGLFALLEEHAAPFATASARPADLPEPLTSAIIRRAACVKVNVVNADEREAGERIVLNYGHTLGHALEAATGYGTLLHGEAVAIGMHAAAGIAVELGLLSDEERARQQRLLETYALPTAFPPDVDLEAVLALTLRDKKVRGSRIRWVLPTAIGSVAVRDGVPEALVRRAIGAAA
jgi:3-dehydroquinate synthase